MLEIKRIRSFSEEPNLPQCGGDMQAYAAYSGREMLGYCLFQTEGDTVVLYDLNTCPKDFAVADGLARAAIGCAAGAGFLFVRAAGDGEELAVFAVMAGMLPGRTSEIENMLGCRGGCSGCAGAGSCALQIGG